MVSIDGTDISDLTIDGEDVQEITIDGDVVWEAINQSDYWDGFENGNFNGWSVANGSIVTSLVYEGSYAFENNHSLPDPRDEGEQNYITSGPINLDSTEAGFAYYETSSSSGMAYKLYNENGDIITAVGTGNVQIAAEHAGGTWHPASGQYDTWHFMDLTLNWGSQTFDITVSGGWSGSTSGLGFVNPATEIGHVGIGSFYWEDGGFHGTPDGEEWNDYVWGNVP